ncbi:hypothetical protein EBU94_05730, partial [bacterium]|nr:hypothetical protein [bacterium]
LLLNSDGIEIDRLADDYVDFLSLSVDNTKISYIHHPKEGADILTQKRYSCKPGVVLSKIFKNLDQRQVELFATQFKSFLEFKNLEFSVVSGDSIIKWYYEENYAEQPRNTRSSLHASCMKYKKCSSYVKQYANNPEKVSMLILKNSTDRIIGRALLWNISDDLKVMDRIYTFDDEKIPPMFMNWADTNGYLYKFFQRWNNNCWFGSKGEKIYKEIEFQFNLDLDYYFPYFDTFKFFNKKTGMISNVMRDENKNNTLLLISAEGSCIRDPHQIRQDHFNKEFYYSHEVTTLRYLPEPIIVSRSSELIVYSDHNDCYILKEDAVRHSRLGWIFGEKSKNSSGIIDYLNKESEQKKREPAL